MLSGSAETSILIDSTALHYLFKERERNKKLNPEAEISHKEQNLTTKFTGPTGYRKKKKKKKLITNEFEASFNILSKESLRF